MSKFFESYPIFKRKIVMVGFQECLDFSNPTMTQDLIILFSN